jgi:lysophospholipase L1-like esterase
MAVTGAPSHFLSVPPSPPISSFNQSSSEPVVIVTFGDSTTAPRGPLNIFAKQLETRLANDGHRVRIVNAGVPSNDTRDARQRLDQDVISHRPKVVTILFGINDSAVDFVAKASEPRVPLREYEQNLTWITKRLQRSKIQPIIITPNPVAWTDNLKELYGRPPYRPDDPDGWNVFLKDYAQAARRVAKACRVPLVDVYQLFQKYASEPGHSLNDLMLDGMHPNDLGHTIVANHLIEVLKNLRPWRRPGS